MQKKIIAIITGDIVGSRKINAKLWLKNLKSVLKKKGTSPGEWEIFRGDMFQLQVELCEVLSTALEIKASIKQIKNIDVRIAIGLGTQEYKTSKITESNGNAYSNSGTCFENLKKRRLAIKTPWINFDTQWNLNFRLLSLTTDNWTPTTAKIVEEAMKNNNLNQTTLAKKLKRSQSTISGGLNRAGYEEINLLILYFNEQLNNIVKQK